MTRVRFNSSWCTLRSQIFRAKSDRRCFTSACLASTERWTVKTCALSVWMYSWISSTRSRSWVKDGGFVVSSVCVVFVSVAAGMLACWVERIELLLLGGTEWLCLVRDLLRRLLLLVRRCWPCSLGFLLDVFVVFLGFTILDEYPPSTVEDVSGDNPINGE